MENDMLTTIITLIITTILGTAGPAWLHILIRTIVLQAAEIGAKYVEQKMKDLESDEKLGEAVKIARKELPFILRLLLTDERIKRAIEAKVHDLSQGKPGKASGLVPTS